MNQPATTVDQLKYARGLIKAGWTKHRAHRFARDGKVSYCTVGALGAAGANILALELVRKHLREVVGASVSVDSIPTLNDWPWTRKRHVLKAFDRAIAEAKQQARVESNVIHVNF